MQQYVQGLRVTAFSVIRFLYATVTSNAFFIERNYFLSLSKFFFHLSNNVL